MIRNTVREVVEKGYVVIVVDDCSKDNSGNQLKGLPIHYLQHRVNMGQGAALQTGIDFAIKRGANYAIFRYYWLPAGTWKPAGIGKLPRCR